MYRLLSLCQQTKQSPTIYNTLTSTRTKLYSSQFTHSIPIFPPKINRRTLNHQYAAMSTGALALGAGIVLGAGMGWISFNKKSPPEPVKNPPNSSSPPRPNTTIKLYAFGENAFGQYVVRLPPLCTPKHLQPTHTHRLGLADESDRFIPALVHMDEEPISISAASKSSAVVTRKGSLLTFGYSSEFRLGLGTDLLSQTSPCKVLVKDEDTFVAAAWLGEFGGLFLTRDGVLYSFGRNARGENGNGSSLTHTPTPTRVVLEKSNQITIVNASRGRTHCAFVDSDGHMYICGSVGFDNNTTTLPVQCVFPDPTVRITQVACGRDFTLALDSVGRVWGMGSDETGALSLGKRDRKITSPRLITSISTHHIKSIAAGEAHSAVVDVQGRLYMSGSGGDFRLGTGLRDDVSLFTEIPLPRPVKKVALGGGHSAVILDDDTLWMFGRGRSGQLARLNELESVASPRPRPQPCSAFAGKRVIDVALGGDHSLVLVMS